MTSALKDYEKVLKSIAFLLPADVDRCLFAYAHDVNVAIVHARAGRAELRQRLLGSILDGERALYTRWLQRVAVWRSLRQEHILLSFAEFAADRSGEEVSHRRVCLLGHASQHSLSPSSSLNLYLVCVTLALTHPSISVIWRTVW